tara:strand:+ start:55 stop:1491 length:1437 start_codon:yes stop_codon:yes gene_type:complete
MDEIKFSNDPIEIVNDESSTPFPEDFLGNLKTPVLACKELTQAPIEMSAQSALAISSFVAQRHIDVMGLSGSSFPCSLFHITIAKSGERKTQVDKLLMYGCDAYEAEQRKSFDENIKYYNVKKELFDQEKLKIIKKITNAKTLDYRNNAENDLSVLINNEPDRPTNPTLFPKEGTWEGIFDLYKYGQSSLGLFNNEAGMFLGGIGMNKDNIYKMICGLSSLWDGQPISKTRKVDGHDILRDKRLCLHLMTQPLTANKMLMSDLIKEQGFLPRCLIVKPKTNIGFRLFQDQNDFYKDAITEFHNEIRYKLLEPIPDTKRIVGYNDKTKQYLIDYYNEIEERQQKINDLYHVSGFASKSAEQACRIASVLMYSRDMYSNEISEEDMLNGIELSRYYLNEILRILDYRDISNDHKDAQELLDYIRNHKEDYNQFKVNYLVRHAPNRFRKTDRIRQLLSILEEHNHIVRSQSLKGEEYILRV